MYNISDSMHCFLAEYLVETEKLVKIPGKSCFLPHVRGIGLIGLELSILIVDVVQLAIEILLKITLPIVRLTLHIMSKCFPCLKERGKYLKDLNEAAKPTEKAINVIAITAGLVVSAVIGWLLPCINESWHNTLGLNSPKGTCNATIELRPV